MKQGALNLPLAPAKPLPVLQAAPDAAVVRVAVVGAHLSGMPLNSQLTERGATLVQATHTAPCYKLYALPGTTPPKPGLLRVASGQGHRIALEIWEMPMTEYGSFVALIPAPLGIGTLQLFCGGTVQGFICESAAIGGALDISAHGGWRKYIESGRRSQNI